MALPSNHVGPTDNGIASTRRQKKRRRPQTSEYSDEDAVYSNAQSDTTPSIIELKNLRMDGSEHYPVSNSHYSVSNRDHDSYSVPPVTKSPIKTFLPTQHGQEGRSKTTVYVSVVVLKIGEIETIKEYFESDVYIQARWREPALDNTRTRVTDFSQFWNPELVVQNVFEDPRTRVWHEVRFSPRGEAFIYEMRRVKGKFYETMELNDFPFDIQSISIVLTSELTKDLVEVKEDPNEVSAIHIDCFSDSQEWTLHNFVEISPLDISSQYTRASKDYSGMIVTCCVSRRYGFFAWNVLAIVILLTLFAFTTFAVKPSLTQNRLQLSFILLLAGISFRFVTNTNIPKISYLTHLDRYMLISTIFSGCISLWHAILSRITSESLQEDMDFWAFIIFAVAYFIFQCIFIFIMLYERRVKLGEVREKEQKYKDKADNVVTELFGVLRHEFSNVTSHLDLRRRSNIHFRPR